MRTNLFASLTAPLMLFVSSLHMLAYGFTNSALDDLNTTNHIVSLSGSEPIEYNIRNIGDINGDGIEDLAISDWDSHPIDKIYIVFGNKNSTSSIDLDNLLVNGQGFMISNVPGNYSLGYVNDNLGSALSPAGDINDDGVNDFIVGGRCEAYVFFGRKQGFTNINITAITQTQAFRIYSAECNNTDLVAVSNAGDFNNDGIDDIMIGITTESPLNRFRAGSVYILFGHDGPFSNVYLREFRSGTQGLKIIGAQANDSLGGSVNSVGDFNDDGIDDVILAFAFGFGNSFVDSNNKDKIYVIYGHEGEFQDLDLAVLSQGQGFQILINKDNDYQQYGHEWYWLTANAGDFNGDGINDIAIATSNNYIRQVVNYSLIYVVFGVPGGLSDFNLSDFSSNQGFQVIPDSGGPIVFMGNSADINDDGMSDLIFGLFGFFHVIYGRNDRVSQIPLYDLTSEDGFKINATTYAGFSGDSIDFNNDGAMDLAIGISGAPHISVILNTPPQSKTNVTAIVVGTVVPCVIVIVCVLIYVKRRKGLKQKAEANKKKMEYTSQMSNQDSPVVVSWPASPPANSQENIPTLVKVQQRVQKYVLVPELFIEFAPKGYHPENTSVPVENKEENQSIKDLALVLGQNIEDNKQGNGEREEQNQQVLDISALLAQGVQDEGMPQEVPAKHKKAAE